MMAQDSIDAPSARSERSHGAANPNSLIRRTAASVSRRGLPQQRGSGTKSRATAPSCEQGPEERACAAPTTERLFELFADLRRHRLVDEAGRVYQRFYDKLGDPQRAVLRLFNISPQQYLSAAEESAAA